MRALVVLVLLAGSAAAQKPPLTEPVGFSHAVHDKDVQAKQQPPLACTKCHAMRNGVLAGKPDHATCFGTCHKPPTTTPVDAQHIALCNPCHAETALAAAANKKALAVTYPPYQRAPEHALQLGHQAHRDIACDKCHERKKGPPHRRCTGCHDGAKAKPMLECERCHVTPTAELLPPDPMKPEDPPRTFTPYVPQMLPQQLRVTTAFSHARHATRGAAKQCTTCHAGLAATDARALPRPAATTCAIAGCHDGKPVFGITAQCRKCHQDVPVTKYEVARPTTAFSHTAPHHEAAKLPCATCHPLGKSGEVLVAGHAACAACHADDFTKRAPEKCGACHNSTEPWRPLVADRLPAEATEFGAALDHGKHALPCASCHSLASGRSELRPPRGHVACATAGCHAVTGGPAPQLAQCEGCHVAGLAQQRERARLAATWSVRSLFLHAPHRRENGKDIACTRCHVDLRSASVLSLASPPKQACVDCHNGSRAFDVTGTRCTRCHLGAKP